MTTLQDQQLLLQLQSALQKFCVAFTLGRTLTVYYKRTFSFSRHGEQMALDFLSVLLSRSINSFLGSRFSLLFHVLALLCSFGRYGFEEKIKSVALSAGIALVLYGEIIGTTLQGEPLTKNFYESGMLIVASTQFLRNPEWLKNLLSEFRIICGPLFPILACGLARFIPCGGVFSNGAACIPVFAAVAAATVFRPDNNETLAIISKRLLASRILRRKLIHGVLMAATCVILFTKILLSVVGWTEGEVDKLAKVGIIFGVMDFVLYSMFKVVIPRISLQRQPERYAAKKKDSEVTATADVWFSDKVRSKVIRAFLHPKDSHKTDQPLAMVAAPVRT